MIFKMLCPKCNTDKQLAVATDRLYMNSGPEGPLHVIRCLGCGVEIHSIKLPGNFHRVRGGGN